MGGGWEGGKCWRPNEMGVLVGCSLGFGFMLWRECKVVRVEKYARS